MDFVFPAELKTYVVIADIAFLGFAVMALVGGIVAVGARQLIHAVLGLILSLVGVAGIYIYLGNHFIAAMQILIYVGAVAVSLVFAVMLARPPREMAAKPLRSATKIASGAIVAFLSAVIVGRTVMGQVWEKVPLTNSGETKEIGKVLLTRYALAFELISLVLLIAIVGSVIIARKGRGAPNTTEGA